MNTQLPSTGRLAAVRIRLELLQFMRERSALVFTLAYPIGMFAIFATVFFGDVASNYGPEQVTIDFATYFLPGMIATGLMLTSFQQIAVDVALERENGTLKRLRATPMPASAFFLGKVGMILTISVVQIAALLALAKFQYGVDLPTSASAWGRFAWLFVLSVAGGTILGVAFSGLASSARSASVIVSTFVLVLQFISGVFFPFFQLPGWMQSVSSIFPLRWMALGMRSVFLPDGARYLETGDSWLTGLTAGILAAWLLAGLVVGTRTFRWARRDAG